MNTFDDEFLIERKDELISEQCLDSLFTNMNFGGLTEDFSGAIQETTRCTSPNGYASSPATPLLTSWNYLDTIKEDSVFSRDEHLSFVHRSGHRRVVSYDDVHRIFGDKVGRDDDLLASFGGSPRRSPERTSPFTRPLPPRQTRHSLPCIFLNHDLSPQTPEMGAEFGHIEFPTLTLPPRSFTEPPETSSPLHFVIENPAARLMLGGSSPKRRHSATPSSPVFKCTVDNCGKAFSRLYNLHSHVKSHEIERPFVCSSPECTSSFARCHDLKRHEKTHIRDKPYMCVHCKRAFTRNDALTRHLRGSCPLMMTSR